MASDNHNHLWLNYQREYQVRQWVTANLFNGQTLNNATTDPGFGGIAFWPVPAALHRGQ